MGSKEDMRQIVAMMNKGSLSPVVDQVFPLEQASEAHSYMEGRSFFGKMVLTM